MKVKERDVVNVIFKISKLASSITDEEFDELECMAQQQCDYVNPLKCATTAKQHALGDYNKKVIACLKDFKNLIVIGKELHNG